MKLKELKLKELDWTEWDETRNFPIVEVIHFYDGKLSQNSLIKLLTSSADLQKVFIINSVISDGLDFSGIYLTNLQSLNIEWSNIEELPESIENLTSLIELNLNGNKFREVPETIGKLTKLQKLNLEQNNIVKMPDSIGNLNNLQEFKLTSNKLELLPASIGNIISLEHLKLDDNQILELPDSIGFLTNLNVLSLEKNKLEKLPESIGNLKSLEILNLSYNAIKELPESIGNCKNLKILLLNVNGLTVLPDSIGNLENLTNLNMNVNNLVELPISMKNLKNLKSLDLHYNEIERLPDSFGNITNLTNLDLSKNYLTQLPPSIVNLKNLKSLNILKNDLLYCNDSHMEEFPEEIEDFIGELESLNLPARRSAYRFYVHNIEGILDLSYNRDPVRDTDGIPNDLFMGVIGVNLRHLKVNGIHVKRIPRSLGRLKYLETLDLRDNPELNYLPDFLWTMPKLSILHIDNILVKFIPKNAKIILDNDKAARKENVIELLLAWKYEKKMSDHELLESIKRTYTVYLSKNEILNKNEKKKSKIFFFF